MLLYLLRIELPILWPSPLASLDVDPGPHHPPLAQPTAEVGPRTDTSDPSEHENRTCSISSVEMDDFKYFEAPNSQPGQLNS
eukprot:m.191803 g.191803  ORF g.191803 m.191803 type:complete len:82 (+) comp16960_c0_seq5:2931-3176(+)